MRRAFILRHCHNNVIMQTAHVFLALRKSTPDSKFSPQDTAGKINRVKHVNGHSIFMETFIKNCFLLLPLEQ